MIDKLKESPPYELPAAVSRAIKIIGSPTFFLRIASRVDSSTSSSDRQSLLALADNLTAVVSAVVKTGEERMELQGERVRSIISLAAEDNGEFYVPLSRVQLTKIRKAVDELDIEELDEGFLNTVEGWLDRSSKDGMDGMVVILQDLLQAYAGSVVGRRRNELIGTVGKAVAGTMETETKQEDEEASREAANPGCEVMSDILKAHPSDWDVILNTLPPSVTLEGLLGEVQRTIEGVVLGMDNGSVGQRVCAEYLREIVKRVENARV